MTTRIMRRPQVEASTGLSRSTLYAMMAEGEFPGPIRLGKRAVGWSETEVSEWLETRKPQRSARLTWWPKASGREPVGAGTRPGKSPCWTAMPEK